jgi:tetratricopeptide (TPR) repeat protein
MSRLLAWAIIVSLTLVANAGSVNSEPAPGDGSKIGQLHGRDWTLTSLRKAQVELETAADEQEASGESLKAWEQLNDAARISLITSEVASGMRILDRALLLPRTAETREQRAISHSLYALLSQQRSDRKETERHSRIALDSLPFLNSAVAKAYVHFSAGVNAYYYGKNRDAVDRFEAAGSLVPFPEDPFLTNQVCLFSGYARLRDGDSSSASAWMDRALSYAESDDYSRGSALAHFGKGYAHFFRNEKQLALESFKRAYALFPDDFEWREKGRTKNAMGQIYLQMSDHGLAAAHFREAIEFYDRVDYSVGKITALTNLGEAYHQGGDGGSAKATLQEARNLSEKIGDKFRVAVAEEGLGNIFLSERKAEEAIRLYRSALAIYEKIGIRFPVINNLLGKAYLQKGNTKLAGEFFELALRENEEIRDNIQISESLYELAKLDLADGGIESAISRIERSLKLTETTYRDIENSGLRRTFLSNSHRKYGLYIDLLMESHRRAPEAGFDRKALLASWRPLDFPALIMCL